MQRYCAVTKHKFHCLFITITIYCQILQSSGVARVPCALGQKTFLRLLSTKPTEFEAKNRYKNAKDAKAEQIL